MAINILILKDGRPVSGVTVSYDKTSFFGGSGCKTTDSSGYVTFDADHGEANVRVFGKGIDHCGLYYLNSHVEIRFWYLRFKILIFYQDFFDVWFFLKIFKNPNFSRVFIF